MKKYILIMLCFLLLTGCQTRENIDDTDEKLYQEYQKYYTRLKKHKDFVTSIDECSISLILNKTNKNNTRYDIIIDQPLHEMKNIKAIAYIKEEKKYNPPSIGLLEEQSFSLKPNVIDKEKGIYKGINLSGMTIYEQFSVKLYLTYSYQNKLIERYVILYGDAFR